MADEAVLADTHAKIGLHPTWGMRQQLPLAVGRPKAPELSLTARNVKGLEAAEIGLACRSVPLDELDETVAALADQLGLDDGLSYEYRAHYPIADTGERLASFR